MASFTSDTGRLAIVGAGMAGLYAGLLLQQRGVDFQIFEANTRIGGRIWTHRFTPDDHQYFEVGAMRIPRSSAHQPVLDLIEFINRRVDIAHKVTTIPYILNYSGNIVFVNNRRTPCGRCYYASDRQSLTARVLGFTVPEQYLDYTADELLESILWPFLRILRDDFDKGFAEILKYDDLSFRLYLKKVAKWPSEVISFVEVMCSQTNQYSLSFTELIMQNMDFSTDKWVTIEGGMDRLPNAMAHIIGNNCISLDARVTDIASLPNGLVELCVATQNGAVRESFSKVLLAIPPSALRRINHPPWLPKKEASIRSIHFEPLYKLGLRFKRRFWEQVSRPSYGGQSTTDLPSRWIVYPSNGIGTKGPGVLLTYCWMTDATFLLPLSKQERIDVALRDLATLYYPEVDVYKEFIEGFDACWSEYWATGDSMFLPGQYAANWQAASRPEGNIHFAGEHISRHHTWITGALESALFAVRDILADEGVKLG